MRRLAIVLLLLVGCRWDWDGLASQDAAREIDVIDDGRVYDVCLEGGPISQGSICVGSVCTLQPDCCEVAWNRECVQVAEVLCDEPCSGMAIVANEDGVFGVRAATIGDLPLAVSTDLAVSDVAPADFDRDGDLDLAYADDLGWTVLRDDTGIASLVTAGSDPTLFTAATFPQRHLEWADWDRDGDLDFAISGDVGIFLVRNDDGAFVTVTPALSTEPYVKHFDWGDLDGQDGLDLVHGNHGGSARVTIYRNDGSGHFAPELQPDTVIADSGVRLCNVVGDARPDLVSTGDSNAGTFARVFENVDGAFSTSPALAVDAGYLIETHCADLDKDGDLDVVANYYGDPYKVRVFRNNAGVLDDGTVYPETASLGASGSMDVGDVDGDGRYDLVISGYDVPPATMLNTTTATSSPITFADPFSLTTAATPPRWLAVDLAPLPP
jgi:hypothetical protein